MADTTKWVQTPAQFAPDADGVQQQTRPAGYTQLGTDTFSATPPQGGEILHTVSDDIREGSLGIQGGLYKGSDGYYSDQGKADSITDDMIPNLLTQAGIRQQQAITHNQNDHTVEFAAMAGFAAILGPAMLSSFGAPAAEAGSMAAGGSSVVPGSVSLSGALDTAVGSAANMSVIPGTAGGMTAASTVPAALTAGAVGGAVGGEVAAPAATPAAAAAPAPSLLNTALSGAAKSAALSGVSQIASTGHIDFGKLITAGALGGFGGVISSAVGGGFPGALAGAAAAGVVGGIINGRQGAATGAVSGAVSGATSTPKVNDVGLQFSSVPLSFNQAPRIGG